LIFYSLSSGSSGNCYYLGNGEHGILIDAGISATSIRNYLKLLNIPIQSITGILVSHNHSDHIRGLEVLSRRNDIPVYTTSNVWRSIFISGNKISRDYIMEIPVRKKFHLSQFVIEAFPVCHDAPETLGFHICAGSKKITIATDLGHICKTSAAYIKEANLLVIESNYDEDMLLNGSYPKFLKARISSDHGHLGNHQTSGFLADNIGDNLEIICLAHLSRNNNTPGLALGTLHKAFSEKGIILNGHPRISVLKRNVPSEIVQF
jgi:phosphoribosyl 1,2-cyclic phosphodiesterase